jgi:hypothetical protein
LKRALHLRGFLLPFFTTWLPKQEDEILGNGCVAQAKKECLTAAAAMRAENLQSGAQPQTAQLQAPDTFFSVTKFVHTLMELPADVGFVFVLVV